MKNETNDKDIVALEIMSKGELHLLHIFSSIKEHL